MQHKLIRLILCLTLLFTAACAPQPTSVPAPTDTPLPPTATSVPPTAVPTPTLAPPSFPLDVVPEIDTMIESMAAQSRFSGSVLIASQGEVLLSKGYGMADQAQNIPNTPQTRFRLASITKQFTALAVLMLQDEGKLNVDDLVCPYIPDCPESWQGIKIHHLLTHTAGLFDFRDFAYNEQTSAIPSTSAQVIDRIKAKPLGFAPGTSWGYSNGNFMVAGYVVEQVSGQPYEQFLREHIFAPLGMTNTGYVHDDSGLAVGYDNGSTPAIRLDNSLPFAAAGLYSTVEDLRLYAQALSDGRLLSQQSLDAFFGLHEQVDAAGGFGAGYQLPVYYGYGWAIASSSGHRMIGHDGWIEGYSSDLRRFPDDKVTMIVLMNRTTPYAPTIGDLIVKKLFE